MENLCAQPQSPQEAKSMSDSVRERYKKILNLYQMKSISSVIALMERRHQFKATYETYFSSYIEVNSWLIDPTRQEMVILQSDCVSLESEENPEHH